MTSNYKQLPLIPNTKNYPNLNNFINSTNEKYPQNIHLPDNSSDQTELTELTDQTEQTIQVKFEDSSEDFIEPHIAQSILTKEKQNLQKRKQKESIILRTFVFMRMLVNNFKFTFVIQKNKRNSYKGLQYFPIEKVYNEKGEMIYDIDSINISVSEKKIRYCQIYVIELMRKELERFGYQFKKKQTKKAKKERNGHQPITLTKVKMMLRTSDMTKYSMDEMEQRIGFDGYNTLKELFVGSVDKFIFGNKETMDMMHSYFIQTRVVDQNTDFIREGNDDLLENVYFGEIKEEINGNQQDNLIDDEITQIEQIEGNDFISQFDPMQQVDQTDLSYCYMNDQSFFTSDSTSFISGFQ